MLLRRGISMSTGGGSGGGGTTIYDANTSNLNGSNQYFQPSSAVTSGLSTITFYAKIKTTTLAQDYIYFETTGSTGQTGFGIFQDGSSGNIKAGYSSFISLK